MWYFTWDNAIWGLISRIINKTIFRIAQYRSITLKLNACRFPFSCNTPVGMQPHRWHTKAENIPYSVCGDALGVFQLPLSIRQQSTLLTFFNPEWICSFLLWQHRNCTYRQHEAFTLVSIPNAYFPSNTASCALTAIQVVIIIPTWCIALAKRLGDVLPFIW